MIAIAKVNMASLTKWVVHADVLGKITNTVQFIILQWLSENEALRSIHTKQKQMRKRKRHSF